MSEHFLPVPGATLHYTTSGSGPLLILIPGANGTGNIFHPTTLHLSSSYTCITYSRRGYSKSALSCGVPENKLNTDADDAAALIQHLSPDNPAYVFGSSSGAIVALTVLLRHGELVAKVIAHEPPAVTLLPAADTDSHVAVLQKLIDGDGLDEEAMMTFVGQNMTKSDAAMMAAGQAGMSMLEKEDAQRNTRFWTRNELVYPRTVWDVEALGERREKLVLVVGSESLEEDIMAVRPNKVLAEKLGLEVVVVPGGHLGYATRGEGFAEALVKILG